MYHGLEREELAANVSPCNYCEQLQCKGNKSIDFGMLHLCVCVFGFCLLSNVKNPVHMRNSEYS